MICLHIGNKYTTISCQENNSKDIPYKMIKRTTIKFLDHNAIEIGASQDKRNVIYDFVANLGVKYQDQQFSRFAKFYGHDFDRNKWGKIQILARVPESATTTKTIKFNVETLMALYLRVFLSQFRRTFYPDQYENTKQFIGGHKFQIVLNGIGDHPSRYALKQACQIAGIDSPILTNSSHCILSSYYLKQKSQLVESEDIILIRLGDRATTISVYKMQPNQDKIIEVIETKFMKKGGYHLTKRLGDFFIQKIKLERGIDISRHSSLMNVLHSECQNAKILVMESAEKEAHIRIPDLPDQSTFDKTIDQKELLKILEDDIKQLTAFLGQVIQRNKQAKQVLICGGSSNIPIFRQKLQTINSHQKVLKVDSSNYFDGIFLMKKQEVVLFDISDFSYVIVGQENFNKAILDEGDSIPERKTQLTKFPAGQLEFNLRIFENNVKVAHFLMESRPVQSEFFLNFQIDRNKLVWMYAKTDKGKIQLPANFQALTSDQIAKQIQIIQPYNM